MSIAAAGLPGCGGPPGGVSVVYAGTKVEDRFGKPSERQKKAQRQLDELVGHAVTIEVDEALASRWSPDGYAHIEEGVLGAARELGAVKAYNAEAFEGIARKVQRIRYVYTAIGEHSEAKLSESDTLLTVTVADAESGCLCSDIKRMYVQEHQRRAEDGYANMRPEQVPVEQFGAYISALGKNKSRSSAPSSLQDPDVVSFERIVALHRRFETQPPTDEKGKKAWEITSRELTYVGDHIASAYHHQAAEIAKLGQDSGFRRLESAWVAFMRGSFWSLVEYERTRALKIVFSSGNFTTAFQALDRVAMANAIFDRWVQAGAPVFGRPSPKEPSADERTFNALLCPSIDDQNGVPSNYPQGCSMSSNDSMYDYLRKDPARFDAFVSRVVAKRDAKISYALFYALMGSRGSGNATTTWRRFESDEASHLAIGRAVAAMTMGQMDEPLYEECARLYRQYPKRRGMVLYVLASMDTYTHGFLEGRLKALAKEGQLASEADFAAFLDEGPKAFRLLGVIWPLLGKGFSRAATVNARLERLLADKGSRGYDALRTRLCEDGARQDLAALATALGRYVDAHPADERAYRSTLDMLKEPRCGR
jgi:hypothetical protein